MPRILIPTRLAPEGVAILNETPGFRVEVKPGLKGTALHRAMANADALIIRSDNRIDAKAIAAAKRLKLIGRAGVGVENINLHAAGERGIVVLNTPAANSIAVAELTMALMLALARKIVGADRSMKAGRWEKSLFKGHELYGKTLGLVGLGRIGRAVALRAAAFGMSIIAYDPFVTRAAADAINVHLVKLPELLRGADVISLHLPLNDKTRGLIGLSRLRRCKPTALLINASRGGIVREDALKRALDDGHIAGCALDVFETEPPADRWFAGMDNVIVTPHLGASTAESQTKVAIEIANAVRRALTEGVFVNAVNLPLGDPSDLARLLPYVHLSEKLGVLLRALEEGPCAGITIELGAQTVSEPRLIQAAVLQGFLDQETDSPVSLVNAATVADERRLPVAIADHSGKAELSTTVTVQGRFGRRRRRVAGTVGHNGTIRIRAIDDFSIDLAPAGRVLIFSNRDRPGVIGAVGAVLGRAGINIAAWILGRRQRGGTALGIVTVDDPVPASILRELGALPNMGRVVQVNWGDPGRS